MALIAWYRPYNAIEDSKDYGKDTNPSNLVTKTTNNNITYYSLQNDFSSALKSAGDLTLSVVLTLPESVDFIGFKGIASVASGRILGLYREENEGVYPAFVYCDKNNKSSYLISTVPLELGETSYVTSVQASDRITIYVNGELTAEVKINLNAGYALPSYILNDVRHLQDGALNSIEGIEWGDLRVYDEALSEGEVKSIYDMATFGKANYDSVFRGALIVEGDDTGKIDIASNTLIMKDATGSWRTLNTADDFKSDSPVYFYRGPNHPDPETEGIKDGFLISRGPADLRKALDGSYENFFEYSGPVYLNFVTSGVGLVRYAGYSYTPGDNNILLGAVAEDYLRRYSIVNLNIGKSATSKREFNSDFFRGIVTSELDMPTRPWNVGDYIVAGDDVDAFELVKGNAYTYNGTRWVAIEANGANGSKLQELLGILLEAGVDLDDISSANTVSWFNTIVANAIIVGHMTLVITQYGFSTSNTVEPRVWSPTLDLSEDGQYMEATWGDSYITWEDKIIRFVIAEGDFLWTRTSSDNGKTWQVHCVTGEAGASVESITPLYYYTDGNMPSRPTQPVLSVSKAANQWTRVLPDLIDTTYKYYTCSEIEFDSTNAGANGFAWSEVIEDTIAEQAGYSYYQFTATEGLFQSIQGEVDKSVTWIENTPTEISLGIKNNSPTKQTIGGIIIALDSNGNPYIKLDGNADITGALTTVDVYSKSLRDYASNRSQPVDAYTGNKFLPSDLSTGYALADASGSLQANNAYIQNGNFKNINAEGLKTTAASLSQFLGWGAGGIHINYNGSSGDPHYLNLVILFTALSSWEEYSYVKPGVPICYRGTVRIAGYNFDSAKGSMDSSEIGDNECYLVSSDVPYPNSSMCKVVTFYKGGNSISAMYLQTSSGNADYISYNGENWRAYSPTSSTNDQVHATLGWSYTQPAIKGISSWRRVTPSDLTPVTIGDANAPFDYVYGDSFVGKKIYSKEIYGEKVYGAVFNR